MNDFFKTISTNSNGIYKEKGSKFLSFAICVNNADEVKDIVKKYKKEYYDARHVCYAYMLGSEYKDFRTYDDGEPAGTAGRPILGQINSRELTNILVVVVRYFGGILLGTGGLATAYKEAASDALNNTEIISKSVDLSLSIEFEYVLMNDIMRIIKEFNAPITRQSFDNICKIEITMPKQDAILFSDKLNKIYGVKIIM
jgi:uncharacterized YigZ family protein